MIFVGCYLCLILRSSIIRAMNQLGKRLCGAVDLPVVFLHLSHCTLACIASDIKKSAGTSDDGKAHTSICRCREDGFCKESSRSNEIWRPEAFASKPFPRACGYWKKCHVLYVPLVLLGLLQRNESRLFFL